MTCYNHLSEDERVVIEKLHCEQGLSIRETARRMGRSPSTVSRELRRGLWYAGADSESYKPYRPAGLKTDAWCSEPFYSALMAQRKAKGRAARCGRRARMASDALLGYVVDALRRGWTPRCIEGRLPLEYPDDPVMRVSHETVYKWIYDEARRDMDGSRDLRGYLPRAHLRRRRRKGRRGRSVSIPGRVSIHERPAAVDSRREFGHWESDTVVGSGVSRRCINTQVERKTRLLVATLIDSKEAQATMMAEYHVFSPLPPEARIDRTWDNGTESAAHMVVDEALGMLTWYADPYSSWQRGGNENRNGMIRRYLPKGTSLDTLTQEQLDDIVHEINSIPLAVLGWRTPLEAWDEEMEKLQTDTPQNVTMLQSTHQPNPDRCTQK